jgi:tetratricopeptide (TPR) repeat protein
MTQSAKEKDRAGQVLALAAGHDPTRLRLSAAEGYLLSRIDGRTPWRLLREIGGIPPSEVDACLERWLRDGLLEIARPKSKAAGAGVGAADRAAAVRGGMDAASVPKVEVAAPSIDMRLLDMSLDIDVDVQRRILEFEGTLSRPYHELLGVPVGADAKTVKRAYFKLSKEFHPDRYFRRQIGPYNARLERIFKKVLEAHEILSDPDLCQVENQSESAMPEAVDPATTSPGRPSPAAAVAPPSPTVAQSASPVSPAASSAKLESPDAPVASSATAPGPEAIPEKPATKTVSKLERLRQRMPFKIDHAGLAERKARALEIFRSAKASLEAGRLHEAETNIRIAITFDPSRAEFKEALGALRIQAAGARATNLLATPSDQMTGNELRDALQLIEDVLPYRPHDPELNLRAALVSLQLEKYDEAVEYVQTLLETAPDLASHHSLLGRIEQKRGDLAAARRAFERALELDRNDLEARRFVTSMRIAAFDAARGGRR